MAFSIKRLARMNEFSMVLNSLGRAICVSLKTSHLSQVDKKLAASDVQSLDFVRWLFGEMGKHPVDGVSDDHDPANDPSFTAEELATVTDVELEEFANKLIQKNKYLLLKTHKGSDIEKAIDESACDFLVRAFRHYAVEEKAATARMMKSFSGRAFAATTLESIQRNLGLSDQLRDTIDGYTLGVSADKLNLVQPTDIVPEFHIPVFPKNPIHETNQKLESVVKQIEGLRPMAVQAAQLIGSLNDAALRMQADYIENAKTAGRQTRIAIWIAAISLIVSAVGLAFSSFFSYLSYVDGKESGARSNAHVEAFQNEIRNLATAQREDWATLVKAILDGQRNVPAAAAKK